MLIRNEYYFELESTNSSKDMDNSYHLYNKKDIIIGLAGSNLGLAGAITCSVLGTILNVLKILTILSRKKVRDSTISPLLFFQGIGYLTLSAGFFPFLAMRFIRV